MPRRPDTYAAMPTASTTSPDSSVSDATAKTTHAATSAMMPPLDSATDGVRSTPSRISTLSETWMGMRKTLADTAIANSAVSSHAAARGVMSEHARQQFPRDLAHIPVVRAARVKPERSFLERNGDEQIYAACYGEDESGHRHHGDREDHEEPTGVNWMANPAIRT